MFRAMERATGWQDQGRQGHGWFGHGTGGQPPGTDGRGLAVAVAYAAAGHLPAVQRGSYENWLVNGGIDQVAAALPAWTAGAHLAAGRFHAAVFGADGRTGLAEHAREVGRALAADDRVAAGRAFADLVAASRGQGMARAMAGAVAQAGTPEARGLVQDVAARRQPASRSAAYAPGPAARPAHPPSPAKRPAAPGAHPAPHAVRPAAAAKKGPSPAEQQRRNVENLALVIYNEARGHGRDAMVAVGWTLRNRMLRNGVTDVNQSWGGYNHGAPSSNGRDDRAAYSIATAVAEGILNGSIKDPTSGATHYYSPQSMPVEGRSLSGAATGGGLEDVNGVVDRNTGQHARNYRPYFATQFPQIAVPGIEDREFKFYRQPEGRSRVR